MRNTGMYAQVKNGVRSLKFIWAPCAQLYSLAETPQLPPPPAFGLIYEALLVSHERDISLGPLICTFGIPYCKT